jgi:glyoxylase-like metal-dependent hydrolase (beta-lactamase superfamily II)
MAVVERFQYQDLEGLRVGRFTSQLNTTCILYRLDTTVLDTGPPNQWRYVSRFLAEKRIRRVLVTHHHEDHSGNLEPIQRRWRPTVLAPASGQAILRRGFDVQLYRRLVWGTPDRVETLPLPSELSLAGGLKLRPLHTPGHSIDSTCFLEPERGWLFTGDLYIASRMRYLRRDEHVGGYIESLRRVLQESFEVVLCSHRGVLADGRAALRRKLDHLITLCEQVRELDARGYGPAQITRQLIGREDHMAWLSRGHFSKQNLVASCLETLDRGAA